MATVAADMKEAAKCTAALTMHQPWASHLVHGVKQTEGRSWPSSHKGWLWIHAAAKKPDDGDIAELEQHYDTTFAISGLRPVFPKNYPISALVGCVYVTEVLPKEEFRKRNVLPHQNSESEFVFMCSKFYFLRSPYQMSGQHKLWRLDRKLVLGLAEGLVPATGAEQLRSAAAGAGPGAAGSGGGTGGGAARPRSGSESSDDDGFDPAHPVFFKNWKWGVTKQSK